MNTKEKVGSFMDNEIKGVLFDFNGTMVFDSPEHKIAWNEFSKKYRHKEIQDEELAHMHGKTNKAIISMLLGDSISEEESELLSKDKEALYRKICKEEGDRYHLVDGLTTLLDDLKAKAIPMTICSASIKDNIEFFIEHFQLQRWFNIKHIIYDDGSHVDKISMFREGAIHIGVPVENCLIIEDSLSGIQYAHDVHAAHIIAITSSDKFDAYKQLCGVDEVIKNYVNLKLPL